ncbi:response regulator transcription factor [Lysobacter niastensis]|uniref:Response regulator transcription factor n=1 Tax=Lysobacter niastensis TaxID=380629 RepID=A0ABS0B4I2_9GAMM|nr:response regulator transcription factor [Lysobacter niastensis]MBF6023540.1 response regulator transcription factor [Lysobacter niastensis]
MESRSAYDNLRIALVEDDDVLRDSVLVPRMLGYGFDLVGMRSARELHELLQTDPPDIVILDIGLPDADGFQLAASLRDSDPRLGIVMLTGRAENDARIRGLVEGADAYLSKPVDLGLLAATLHSLARRIGRHSNAGFRRSSGKWHLDAEGWCLVTPAGTSIALSKTERRLVKPLMSAAGRLVTRAQIIDALTSDAHEFDPHRLDSLIHRLRRKVSGASGEALPLTAVHGEGYVLKA